MVSVDPQNTPEGRKATPERRCVVTREELSKATALRLGCAGGLVFFDAPERGRGAYVRIDRAALERLTPKMLGRAFRQKVQAFEPAALLAQLADLAAHRILETVGLARRQGALAVGVEACEPLCDASSEGVAVVLVAADCARRSQQRLPGGKVFVEGQRLGHAGGLGYVAAVGIVHPELARRAAYWLQVWYESRPEHAEGVPMERRLDSTVSGGHAWRTIEGASWAR